MKEYTFPELGYFTQSQCEALRRKLQGRTFYDFGIGWSNQAGNCILSVSTANPPETDSDFKNFFLHAALSALAR